MTDASARPAPPDEHVTDPAPSDMETVTADELDGSVGPAGAAGPGSDPGLPDPHAETLERATTVPRARTALDDPLTAPLVDDGPAGSGIPSAGAAERPPDEPTPAGPAAEETRPDASPPDDAETPAPHDETDGDATGPDEAPAERRAADSGTADLTAADGSAADLTRADGGTADLTGADMAAADVGAARAGAPSVGSHTEVDDAPAAAPTSDLAGARAPARPAFTPTTSTPEPEAPERPPHRSHDAPSHRRDERQDPVTVTRRRRIVGRVVGGVLVLLLVAASAAAVHLWRTSTAWEERAGDYQGAAQDLGTQVSVTQAELDGARAELEAVRGQLANANTRIAELANEKAQIGDDREAQRQLVDYQERVTEAAGNVALALDQCVQGQQQLITYLRAQAAAPPDQKPYEEAALTQFSNDVDTLCAAATEANVALQAELER